MREMPVTTAVVLTLTMLLLAPLEANAGGRGGGFGGGMRFGGGHGFGHHVVFGRNFLARQHFRSFRDNNFGLWPWWPWYGSYGAPSTSDDYSMAYQPPQTVVTPQVKCQHSEEKRTVPSANGGTTEVTILRC